MNREALCELALAAIDNVDARVVLADAIEESGWTLTQEMRPFFGGRKKRKTEALRGIVHPVGGEDYCRAIAATLLFGSWPTSWPLTERCRGEFTYVNNRGSVSWGTFRRG